MWESLAAFWRDFSKQLVEIRAFCGFPQMRHFHQAGLTPIVVITTDFAEAPIFCLLSKICGSIPAPVRRQAYGKEQLQSL